MRTVGLEFNQSLRWTGADRLVAVLRSVDADVGCAARAAGDKQAGRSARSPAAVSRTGGVPHSASRNHDRFASSAQGGRANDDSVPFPLIEHRIDRSASNLARQVPLEIVEQGNELSGAVVKEHGGGTRIGAV